MLILEGVKIAQGSFSMVANVSVEKGSITAVMGPSGAGKSTFLSAIAGFLPVQGRIAFEGINVQDLPPGKRPMAVVFQDSNLFPHMTVVQNVGLGITPSGRLTAEQKTQVAEALKRVGLDGMAERKPAALSGGQQSRVALARVLVQNKSLVLLDEPFAALGPALKFEMLDLVEEIAREKGLTVLMVTHAPEDARRIAEQVILVSGKKASPPQPTADLLDNPPDALREYLGK